MLKIDRHISDLLYDHDCVIVPAFGGFLASYQSAQHQPIQHTFYPPSKKIAFNVFLKHNDGLLANHIVQQEKLTYSEALKNIERFRTEITGLLDSGKRITVENVGSLFYDKSKNLQFEAAGNINYLEEAFGLTAVQSPPVKRQEQRKKMERQIRQAAVIRSSVKPPHVKQHGKRTTAWKVFNTITLSGAVLWFAFNIYIITPRIANLSSLNPFSYSSSGKVEPSGKAANPESAKGISAPAPIQKAPDAVKNPFPDKQPVRDNSVAIANPPAPKEENIHAEEAVQGEKNFFIIAGAFREPGNAEKLINTLKQEGYPNAEIINPESSFKKVCYNHFTTRKEAILALEQIHAAKKEGWILRQVSKTLN